MTRRSLRHVTALFVVLASAGCAAEDADNSAETFGEVVSQPIIGGAPAAAFTEAVLVNGPGFICSGALVAPKVVLTAGHCVLGTSSFSIVAPYANRQTARGVSTWTEYTETGPFVNPRTNDVAVIVLDRAITLSQYPKLAEAPSASGTKAVNVGRIDDGTASNRGLFVGKTVTLQSGARFGFPYSYVSEEVIESGDSGGPVYLATPSTPRTIAAVNSGGGGGTQVLARVDLAHAKIQQIIAAAGGATSPAPASPPASAPAAPAPACAGARESEPNDTADEADALSGTACGSLTAGDVDWYTWTATANGAYELSLTATGDADVLMWKWNGSAWTRVQSASPTKIAAASASAGKYVVAVRSAGNAEQSYALTLTR